MAHYNYYQAGNKVICVTHYAGKSVKAVAKCNPNDAFDFEFGKKLAKARADVKVAEKRYRSMVNKRDKLADMIRELSDELCTMDVRVYMGKRELYDTTILLHKIENNLEY